MKVYPALRVFLVTAMICVNSHALLAAEAKRDSRPLTPEEENTFVPMACAEAKRTKPSDKSAYEYRCANLNAYPEQSKTPNNGSQQPEEFTPLAIIYGSFSQAPAEEAAEEAYVSYSSTVESHAQNFGGGILFRREAPDKDWKLAKWYPGLVLKNCLAMPDTAPQTLLCSSGYVGMGEIDSSVFTLKLPAENDPDSLINAYQFVIRSFDERPVGKIDRSKPHIVCRQRKKMENKGKPVGAMLLSLAPLKRSDKPNIFAETNAEYATDENIRQACKNGRYEQVKTTKTTIEFMFKDGRVDPIAPTRFTRIEW